MDVRPHTVNVISRPQLLKVSGHVNVQQAVGQGMYHGERKQPANKKTSGLPEAFLPHIKLPFI